MVAHRDLYAGLTERECDVVAMLFKGVHEIGDIAEELCISRSTTKTHLNNIALKLQIRGENLRGQIVFQILNDLQPNAVEEILKVILLGKV